MNKVKNMTDEVLPKESKAQEISRLGTDAFNLHKPKNWVSVSHTGEQDYGIDFWINYKNPDTNKLESGFILQLKTTTAARYKNDTVCCQVHLKNLNYYQNLPYPVMIVLCDLKGNMEDIQDAALYYIWNHEIVIEHSAAINSIKISTKNILNKQFNVSRFLDELRLQYLKIRFQENHGYFVKPFDYEQSSNKNICAFSTAHVSLRGFLPIKKEPCRGCCLITFALPGIEEAMITFDHNSIMNNLFLGINNDFLTHKRGFTVFSSIDDPNEIFIQLGNVRLLVTQEIVSELCSVIDRYSQHYLRCLKQIENLLKLQNFLKPDGNINHIPLVRIPRELWREMLITAQQYDCYNGDSEWHVFLNHNEFLGIDTSENNTYYDPVHHADIIPISDHGYDTYRSFLSPDYKVTLAWRYPSDALSDSIKVSDKALWTIEHTYQWLTECFIPFVIKNAIKKYPLKKTISSYFSKKRQTFFEYLQDNIEYEIESFHRQYLIDINSIKNHEEIANFFRQLQINFAFNKQDLNSVIVFTKEKSDSLYESLMIILDSTNNHELNYINRTLRTYSQLKKTKEIIGFLKVKKEEQPIETAHSIERILRVFCHALEHSKKRVTQEKINQLQNNLHWMWLEVDRLLFLQRHSS